jgi:hypothetical protein
MSKNRSVWKNTSDGKTIRRKTLSSCWSARPLELVESYALRVLSRAAHLALLRVEIELRRRGGHDNGDLIITKEQFIAFGIHKDGVATALRELKALGIIAVKKGRGGNAEYREPNRFGLNYMAGIIDGSLIMPTNTWKRFKTIEQAEQTADAARGAKDPLKVAYGRRNQNISPARKPGLVPGPETGSVTAHFPGPETGSQSRPVNRAHYRDTRVEAEQAGSEASTECEAKPQANGHDRAETTAAPGTASLLQSLLRHGWPPKFH